MFNDISIVTYKYFFNLSLGIFAIINKILSEYCEMKSTKAKPNINLWDKGKILKNTLCKIRK